MTPRKPLVAIARGLVFALVIAIGLVLYLTTIEPKTQILLILIAGLGIYMLGRLPGLVFALGVCLAMFVVTTPLEPTNQAIFGLVSLLGIYFLGRLQSRLVITILTVLSFIFVSRYLYWRMSETLNFQDWTAAVLGYGLFLAELYLWIALLVTYVQSAWPLQRKPMELPEDMDAWPTVDVLIPTYNEDLDIVSKTVLAAKALEYPVDKLNVYILDDGRRQEFRDFAREVGVGYITRDNNHFAKAGNLNNALKHTDGELVAVFDCDHIPTRWFLQLTAGWFLKEPDMAFIQTPHHFYNRDPFLKNLSAGDKVPPEQLLFYGLVQDGNDFWNASFFCGSCALLRRSALEEINGFATETVTEDAETALKMHRRGWQSGFIRVPMAAGLATETLGRFIQQRIRWARGMVQILRIDNPLLGPGLTLPQRLCYLSAMMHFLFPLPRFVLLTAPLAFLLMDVRIITSSAYEVLVHALPYLMIVAYVNWRIQGQYRHSFWSDVYETALTLHLLWPTVKTFLFPKGGKFNVTSKGGDMDETYFDTRLMLWHMVLGGLLVLGILWGIWRVGSGDIARAEWGTALLNLFWAGVSLVYVSASMAVARELAHASEHRVPARLPAAVRLADGRTVAGTTLDMSQNDLRLEMALPDNIEDKAIYIEVDAASDRIMVPAEITSWSDDTLTARFKAQTVEERADLVRLVFGRGDAWIDWDKSHVPATPLQSIGEIFGSIGSFLKWSGGRVGKTSGRTRQGDTEGQAGKHSPKRVLESAMKDGARSVQIVLALIGLGAATLLVPGDAFAQDRVPTLREQDRSAQEEASDEDEGPAVGDAGAEQDIDEVLVDSEAEAARSSSFFGNEDLNFGEQSEATDSNAAFVARIGASRRAPTALPGAGENVPTTQTRSTLTFQQLQTEPSINMYNGGVRSVRFSVRTDEVVEAARVQLVLTYSPSLLASKSFLVVEVNNVGIGTIELDPSVGTTRTVQLDVDPILLRDENELLLRFTGEGASGEPECPTEIDESVFVRIADASRIELVANRFRLKNDLAILPAPFFDKSDLTRLSLPVVTAQTPSTGILQGAAVVASYFGRLANDRGAVFPVFYDEVPPENAVVIARENNLPAGVSLPGTVAGPTLAMVDSPASPSAKVLVITGRNDAEVIGAAQALATGELAIGGQMASVSRPALAPRAPYDADRWLPTDRPVAFGEFTPAENLQGYGLTPGVLTFKFRASPDIFLWAQDGIPVTVDYRYPTGRWIDFRGSRLDVLINDNYIKSLPLESDRGEGVADQLLQGDVLQSRATVKIPPYHILGENRLQFFFQMNPRKEGPCNTVVPTDVRSSIDASSTIDMRGIYRLTKMPNLGYLIQAGFPFTRMADLSETAFVMPTDYAAHDVEAMLGMAGLFGARTGTSGYNVAVITPDAISSAAAKDIVLVGTLQNQPLLREWSENTPFQQRGDSLVVQTGRDTRDGTTSMSSWFTRETGQGTVSVDSTALKAGLVSFQSPLAQDRTVVAMLTGNAENSGDVVDALTQRELANRIEGDYVSIVGNSVTAREVAGEYEIGNLPFPVWAQWYVSDKPIGMIILVVCAGLLLGFPLFTWLRSSANRKSAGR